MAVNLGAVSAYAVAVRNGYTGTEAEWVELITMASLSGEDADRAEAARTRAETARDQAEYAAEQAIAHGYAMEVVGHKLVITAPEEE